jgi:putative Holliday junction resolvase
MLDEVSNPISETVLAFDFGEQRIGIAVGNTLIGIAHPLHTLNSEVAKIRFTQIKTFIDEWQPTLLLVGLPYYLDGQEHELSRLSRRFARRLSGRFAIKVGMWEERLSSVAASQSLNEVGIKGRQQKRILDEVAAQHILQHYLDTPNRHDLLIQL